jgi:predicted O-methyltransferase YrrM
MQGHDEEIQKTLKQLCTLVEALSVHQRQLAGKIEELHLHHEQLFEQQNSIYSQIDCLFSIFSIIKPRHPLPTLRGWPASPDFIKILISIILENRPLTIVELGSGVSTLIQGYCLEHIGKGRIVSIDHDGGFAAVTRNNMKLHSLDSYGDIVHCPLGDVEINDEKHFWYSIDMSILPDTIDLLVVDGPPASYGSTIRYPALPYFYERLTDNGIVLVDDAARPGEKEIVQRWMAAFTSLEQEYVDTEKGTAVIRKKRNRT